MIPAPVVLRATDAQLAQAAREAAAVFARYSSGTARSVYATSPTRIAVGMLAEELAGRFLGRRRADPTTSGYRDGRSDLEPDVEVRSVSHPDRVDRYSGLCVTLYARDRRRLDRRFVLASVEGPVVKLWGWAQGYDLLLPAPVEVKRRDGGSYVVIGEAYPDQLRDVLELVA